jgi:hypothetical protein
MIQIRELSRIWWNRARSRLGRSVEPTQSDCCAGSGSWVDVVLDRSTGGAASDRAAESGGCRSGAGGATDQGYENTSLSIKSCIFHFFVHLYSCDYFMIYILIYCCLFNFPLVHPINAIFYINLVAFFQYFKAKKQVDLHKEFDEHLASGALDHRMTEFRCSKVVH